MFSAYGELQVRCCLNVGDYTEITLFYFSIESVVSFWSLKSSIYTKGSNFVFIFSSTSKF